MRSMHLLAIWLISLLPVAHVAAQQPEVPPPAKTPGSTPTITRAGRADLARAYLRFERAFFPAKLADDVCADVNRDFDRASLAFFTGGYTEAVRGLESAISAIDADGATIERRVAGALRVRLEPPAMIGEGPTRVVASVDSLYPIPFPEGSPPPAPLEISLRSRFAMRDEIGLGFTRPLPLTVANGEISVHEQIIFDIDLTRAFWRKFGSFDITIAGPGGFSVPVGMFYTLKESFSEVREANAAAIMTAPSDTPEQRRRIRTFLSRNALLVDRPSASSSAEFLADLAELSDQLAIERKKILEGRDPYRRRVGDLWRTLSPGDRALDDDAGLPIRIYAPAAAREDRPLPLLVALHGAGGDENMFFEGYGCGILKRLADEHNVIVVCPRVGPFSGSVSVLRSVVDDLDADYEIDRTRIYALGHSMGGGTVTAWAKGSNGILAAACSIAGMGGFSKGAVIPPALIVAAELDALFPIVRTRRNAQTAIDAGLPVEFREISNYGHTLVVGAVLPDVIKWLLEHRSPP